VSYVLSPVYGLFRVSYWADNKVRAVLHCPVLTNYDGVVLGWVSNGKGFAPLTIQRGYHLDACDVGRKICFGAVRGGVRVGVDNIGAYHFRATLSTCHSTGRCTVATSRPY
jgi:hypothetical protein